MNNQTAPGCPDTNSGQFMAKEPGRGQQPDVMPGGNATSSQISANDARAYINTSYMVPYYWPFSGSRPKVFLKRLVRRLAKCLVLPIVDHISALNANFVRCINRLFDSEDEMRSAFEDLAGRQDAIQAAFEDLARREAALRAAAEDLAGRQDTIQAAFEDLAKREAALRVAAEDLAGQQDAMQAAIDGWNRMIAQSAYLRYARRNGEKTGSNNRKAGGKGRNIYSDNQLRATLISARSDTRIKPAFSVPDVSVLFSVSDSYTDYVGTLIRSIIAHADKARTYDLIIFETDISTVHMNMLHALAKEYANISIRFVDVRNTVDIERIHLSNSAYNYFTLLRLIAPDLLADYKKVLYLDADTIVNTDISELYDTDVSGYCLAGALDPFINARMTYENEDRTYLQSIGITDYGTYMQAGVLLLNIKQLRKEFPPYHLFDLTQTGDYKWSDQDILNLCCKGKIKYLDLSWNVFALHDSLAQTLETVLADDLYEAYTTARKDPKIIHYVCKRFPNLYPDGDMAELYWRYARQTPFYERLIYS